MLYRSHSNAYVLDIILHNSISLKHLQLLLFSGDNNCYCLFLIIIDALHINSEQNCAGPLQEEGEKQALLKSHL